ncbi:DNA-binding protein [Lachnoclostridium sp. An14]|uniref:helix-turn-helix domain-containing protein n=1 Tax=Lachnoclostridium sp. An14 TaxID=1965562 RepID=UPI000B36AFC1|nr:XRE family transcriptional regulator [Lachnoclostridium sp. An14]OUQ21520.1 DNA-binding protein [Lachnoclostridium sp. An14]
MDLQKVIGNNIKEIRERRKLTLDAAARQTGVSRSMLAQIEKGDVNPTISVLWKIANGYKVSFTSLVDDRAGSSLLIRGDEVEPLTEADGKYRNYPAFPFRDDRLFETYRIEIGAGGELAAQPHMAGTEEYLTVFAGEVEIRAGEEVFCLAAGDSLRFRADQDHSYKNTGETVAWISMLIYYGKE